MPNWLASLLVLKSKLKSNRLLSAKKTGLLACFFLYPLFTLFLLIHLPVITLFTESCYNRVVGSLYNLAHSSIN